MPDNEISDLLRSIPVVSGWPRRERAWLRARVEQSGANIADVDSWVVRMGGKIEQHAPSPTLPPYDGQPPVPAQTLYVFPSSVLEHIALA